MDVIAAASSRTESLHFGSGDFAASIGARTLSIGGPHPGYRVLADADENGIRTAFWNDMWHYPLMRMIVAARAHGLRPIDGPFADFRDPDGFRSAATRSAVLGCEGKWVIHPSQIEHANTIYTPAEEEVARARRIRGDARRAGVGSGRGTLDGRMIDVASVRQAEAIVRKADAIAAARSPERRRTEYANLSRFREADRRSRRQDRRAAPPQQHHRPEHRRRSRPLAEQARRTNQTCSRLTPWQKAQVARHVDRPHTLDYIRRLVTEFTPLAGDRLFGEDAAMIGGIGRLRGRACVFLGQEKGSDTDSRLKHNFGMPRRRAIARRNG